MAFGRKQEVAPPKKALKLDPIEYAGPFSSVVEIASFYGFQLIEPLPTTKADKSPFKKIKKKDYVVPESYKQLDLAPEDRARLLNLYKDQEMSQYAQPILISHIDRNVRKKEGFLKLEIMGSGKPIAESLLLHLTSVILKEKGIKEFLVHINGLGTEETEKEFREELVTYFRDHINLLDPTCRQAFGEDPYLVFECKCKNPECLHVRENAPRSIGLLPEHDRHHIMSVLEFLEDASLPYEIKQGLFGPSVYHSQDLFEIVSNPDKEILAKGEKYDQLSKVVGLSKQIPSVVMSIKFEKIPKTEKYKKVKKIKDKRPLFYFIQLGHDAKRKSLNVLEILRSAKIRLKHNLFKDDMGSQYEAAKTANAPYIIILGQKEANEDTVIVRNVETRSQDIIPLEELASYVKKLK